MVGGTSFGAPEKFGRGLVEEEGYVVVDTPFGPGPVSTGEPYTGSYTDPDADSDQIVEPDS
ncbi:MAG: hypothetical protein ACFE0O_11945 [Opitutales bacterium]